MIFPKETNKKLTSSQENQKLAAKNLFRVAGLPTF